MTANLSKYLEILLKATLFLSLFSLLIVSMSLAFFPFVFGKMIFYRAVVEVAAVLSLTLFLLNARMNPERVFSKAQQFLTSPLFLTAAAFFTAAGVSTIFAPDRFHAFFGDVERGEGFLGLLHYLIFFVIAANVFKGRDWLWFFGLLLGTGFVIALYAWFQYLEITGLPFAFGPTTQPGSFTGNSAFLATLLILLLGSAAIVSEKLKSKYWNLILAGLSLFFVATIFITAIRGAIIGLALGLVAMALALILSKNSLVLRKAGGVILIALICFSAVFFFTKENSFWRAVPGLDRLSRATFDIPSVSTRLIGLKVSFEAWKERPLFGWGPENYNVAYNKHYDPRYSYYAEDWFDRAHNKIAEVAVMYGGAGLMTYLALFALIFLRVKNNPLLLGSLVAYFVQNLFIFDNITSYIPFFAILGYLSGQGVGEAEPAVSRVYPKQPTTLVLGFGTVALAAAVIYSLYNYHYVPVRQALVYQNVLSSRVGDRILKASDSFLYPYNLLQPTLRGQFEERLYNEGLMKNPIFRPLIDKALAALEETASKEKEPRQYVRLVEAYNELGKLDEKFFEKSELFARKALEFSPNRQGLMYHLAFSLAGRDKFEEAIEVNRAAIALDPRIYKSYYQLGVVMGVAGDAPGIKGTPKGEAYRSEARANLDKAWEMAKENDYLFFLESDFRNLEVIYTRWKDYKKAAEVLEIAVGERKHSANKQFYTDLITLYRAIRDGEGIIRAAERLKVVDPALTDDLDVIIDLAKKRNWEVLDSLE